MSILVWFDSDRGVQAGLSADSRVLDPAAMAGLLQWVQLDAHLAEQRDRAHEALQRELQQREDDHQAQLAARLAAQQAAWDVDLAARQAAQQAALRRDAAALAATLVRSVLEALSDLLQPGSDAALRFFAQLSPALQAAVEAGTSVEITTSADDLADLQQVIRHAAWSAGDAVRLHSDPALPRGRCLVHLGERLIEADLDQWLASVEAAAMAAMPWQTEAGTTDTAYDAALAGASTPSDDTCSAEADAHDGNQGENGESGALEAADGCVDDFGTSDHDGGDHYTSDDYTTDDHTGDNGNSDAHHNDDVWSLPEDTLQDAQDGLDHPPPKPRADRPQRRTRGRAHRRDMPWSA